MNYYWIREYFACSEDRCEINDDRDIVTHKADGAVTVYGNVLIDMSVPYIYEWRLKMLKIENNSDDADYCAGIGIAESTEHCDCIFIDRSKRGFIFWNSPGIEVYPSIHNHDEQRGTFEEGDIVKLTVNSQEGTCKFSVNDEKERIFNHIDWERNYYLAVCFEDDAESSSIQLVDFKQIECA